MTGSDEKPCFYDEFIASGCKFYKVTPRNVSIKKNREDVYKLFTNNRFDILHYSVNTLSYIFPIEMALKTGCKVVLHSRSAYASNLTTRVMHYLNRVKVAHYNVTRIAISESAGKWLFGARPFSVYPNGVDTDVFTFDQASREKVRKKMGCEHKDVIGHVGSFLPVKNHQFMIDVFSNYVHINPQAVLWFIGDGPLRKNIEALVIEKNLTEKVIFWGELKSVSMLYDAMDMLWFPSQFEGLGNVVLEAECKGLPCLISDKVPRSTMIMNNVFSAQLSESINAWSQMLHYTLNHRVEDRRLSSKLMDEKGWSAKKEIEKLEALYKSIL